MKKTKRLKIARYLAATTAVITILQYINFYVTDANIPPNGSGTPLVGLAILLLFSRFITAFCIFFWVIIELKDSDKSNKGLRIIVPIGSAILIVLGIKQCVYSDPARPINQGVPEAIEKVEFEDYDVPIEEEINDNICPDNNHPHSVDVGLPSGVKWSCCNVGSSKPEIYGNYYAWGETRTKSDYSTATSKYIEVPIGEICGTSDDVANKIWGGSWRLPTEKDIDQLVSECNFSAIKLNGIKGMIFTGKNGKSIFLPYAGEYSGKSLDEKEIFGYFWSGTPYDVDKLFAIGLCINSKDRPYYTIYYRSSGFSVRPVTDK